MTTVARELTGGIEEGIIGLYRDMVSPAGPGRGRSVVGAALVLYVSNAVVRTTDQASVENVTVLAGFCGPAAQQEQLPTLARAAAQAITKMADGQAASLAAGKRAVPRQSPPRGEED